MKRLVSFIVVTAWIFLSGCGHNDDHDHDHDNGHSGKGKEELEPLAFTLYSDKTELFVEFNPLVAGEESRFATHLTHLGEYFKPYTKGIVTVRLEINGQEISNTANAPLTPGIFRLALTPEIQGTCRLIFDIQTDLFLDQIIIGNLTVYPDNDAAANAEAGETGSEEITYLKEQAWKVDFANEPVRPVQFSEVIKTSGQITSAPGDESMIVAKSQGIVKLNKTNSTTGARVASGELLFSVTGSDVIEGNIDIRFKELKLLYEKALADYERGKELVVDNIISQKEFLDRENALRNVEILYENISDNYSGDGENVYSPMNGYIKDISVTEGQYVTAGQKLGTVTKNRRLLLTAEVPQQYFSKLGTFSSANFRTEYDKKVYNTDDMNGTLVSYGRTTGNTNFYIPVNIEIDNVGNLISGSFVQVFLISESSKEALTVPLTALIEELGVFYVYVQTGGESFQKREVRLGSSDGKKVEVLSGLEAGERIVTKGAYNIKLAAMSGNVPAHGHAH